MLTDELENKYFLNDTQKWVPGIFLGCKGRTARKANNLTAICESIV
jgi:hypothetical protein